MDNNLAPTCTLYHQSLYTSATEDCSLILGLFGDITPIWTLFLQPGMSSSSVYPWSLCAAHPPWGTPRMSGFHMSSFRAIEPSASRTCSQGACQVPKVNMPGDMSKSISTPPDLLFLQAPSQQMSHSSPQPPKPGVSLPYSEYVVTRSC